jgi:hypothetical protein
MKFGTLFSQAYDLVAQENGNYILNDLDLSDFMKYRTDWYNSIPVYYSINQQDYYLLQTRLTIIPDVEIDHALMVPT